MPEIQQPQTALKPEQIFEIIIRKRWIIIISLCITLSVGLYLTFTLPRTYLSSTTILVQAQRVPGDYVKSIVTTGLNERISTISQQILSRSNLEKIIDEFGLYSEPDYKNMYLEDKIKNMRQRVNVELTNTRRGADAFTISFKGKEPETVMRIANTLARFFMDENLKIREAQAVGTSEFLDAELEKTRKKLVEREQALSDYRAKYLGGLPDELESNLRTLDRLQQQLTDRQAILLEAKNNITLLENQVSGLRQRAQEKVSILRNQGNSELKNVVAPSEEELDLKRAEEVLESMLVKYTEHHPDVIKFKKKTAQLRENVAKKKKDVERLKKKTREWNALKPLVDISERFSDEKNQESQLLLQISQLKNDVQKYQTAITAIENKMIVYQDRVENTPKREQELLSLKRDYGNIRDVYSSLLDRKLEAELAVNMEKKQKGEQFRILDHARLPEKPISPDVKKLLMFCIASALGFSGGCIFLFEMFNSAVRRDEDIEEQLGLPILASVTRLKKDGDVLKNRLNWLCFSMVTVYVLGVLGCFAVVYQKGIIKVLNFINAFM